MFIQNVDSNLSSNIIIENPLIISLESAWKNDGTNKRFRSIACVQ